MRMQDDGVVVQAWDVSGLTVLIPLMLPEVSIGLTIAGPVFKHGSLQIRQETNFKRAVALWW